MQNVSGDSNDRLLYQKEIHFAKIMLKKAQRELEQMRKEFIKNMERKSCTDLEFLKSKLELLEEEIRQFKLEVEVAQYLYGPTNRQNNRNISDDDRVRK